MLDPEHVLLRQAVVTTQSRPAVAAVHELGAEAEDQPGVVAQVGHAFDAEALGQVLAHAEGEVVAEAERRAHDDPALGQQRAQLRLGPGLLSSEDLVGERARVLGVDVDLSGDQRVEDQARAAEGLPMLGGGPRGRRHGADQLAEHDAFGEVLRSDDDGTRRGGQAAAGLSGDGQQGDGAQGEREGASHGRARR